MLKAATEAKKLPHGLLFCGPSKIGKKKVAIELAKLIFCEKNEKNSCGTCRNCTDLEKNAHPDFMVIGENENKEIQMSEIRDVIWKLSLKPYSAMRKIAIIDNAELMNREAQNAFLKTLEEPSGDTLLIMITEHPEMLLKTIASRMQKVTFMPITRVGIQKYLESIGASKRDAEKVADLANGKIGKAIELLRNKEKIQEEERIIENLKKIKDSDFTYRFKYAKNLADEVTENDNFKLKDVFDSWLNYFRLALFDKIQNRDSENIYASYSASKLKKIISLIQSTNFLLATTNANTRLALEVLLMDM